MPYWSYYVCIPCNRPMSKPVRSSDEHYCAGCKRAIDGWYAPDDVRKVTVENGITAVDYEGHVVRYLPADGRITVDGEFGRQGLGDIAGVHGALAGEKP